MQIENLEFPLRETKEVIEAMMQAEEGGDLRACSHYGKGYKYRPAK
jgi:hypothetical protein